MGVVGTSRCDVTARMAGGTYAVRHPTTLVAPLHAALDGAARRPYHLRLPQGTSM